MFEFVAGKLDGRWGVKSMCIHSILASVKVNRWKNESFRIYGNVRQGCT